MLGERVAIKEFFVKDFCNRDEATAHVSIGTQSKRGLVDKLKRKFIEEAKMLYRMQHPGIVRVFDIFEENSTAYFVMDYIDGPSLSEIVAKEGALSEARAVRYIRQVAEALKYVHDQDRLHLDIKPGNIMVDSNDNAILIDFGASKQYDEVDGENTSTLLGKTPGYAPLEQMGNDVVKFLPATDIYALGATLYKLVSGITPMSANLLASGEELEPLPADVSPTVRKAIMRSMNVNKSKRPQTIDDFLALLSDETNVSQSSQASSKQTQSIREEETKLTNEEETLVIGEATEETRKTDEKQNPSVELVGAEKTWKENFKERHPIVNIMMVVMSFIVLHSLLLASFFDYNTIGGALYIGVSCLIVIISLWLLLKHKQSGLLFTALSMSIMSILSLSYFMGTYNYFSSSYLVDFFYYLFNFAIYPVVVLLAYYGILQIKRNGKSTWSLMKPAPSWMKKCVWAVWIILFIAIFGTKRWVQNYEIEQQTKMRIEQQQREKAVLEAEEKIRQQREQETQKEKEKNTTSLYVTTSPVGALVYVDGQYIGTTPIEGAEIIHGNHQIKLSKSTYQDKMLTRTFGNQPVVINETLDKTPKQESSRQPSYIIAEAKRNYEIGYDYYWGNNGKKVNYTEAVKYFRKAADQGNTMALHNLGMCYEHGHGVQKSLSEAVRWYRKAAEQGEVASTFALERLGY